MTPEERAVIDAARRWANAHDPDSVEDSSEALQDAVMTLSRSKPLWVASTWALALAGDTVRLPGRPETQAEVESARHLAWHADVRQYTNKEGQLRDWVTPHEHEKIAVRMVGRTDILTFSPGQEIEILMDVDRRAQHHLQLTFSAESVG